MWIKKIYYQLRYVFHRQKAIKENKWLASRTHLRTTMLVMGHLKHTDFRHVDLHQIPISSTWANIDTLLRSTVRATQTIKARQMIDVDPDAGPSRTSSLYDYIHTRDQIRLQPENTIDTFIEKVTDFVNLFDDPTLQDIELYPYYERKYAALTNALFVYATTLVEHTLKNRR